VSGCVLAGAMSVPLGPTTTGRAVDQMNSSSMRGVPVLPAPRAPRADTVWVPDQYRPIPGHPEGVLVPGHWVQVTPDGHVIVPPLTVTVPGTGQVETLPRDAAEMPPRRESP
jgi:hypothetical protein